MENKNSISNINSILCVKHTHIEPDVIIFVYLYESETIFRTFAKRVAYYLLHNTKISSFSSKLIKQLVVSINIGL